MFINLRTNKNKLWLALIEFTLLSMLIVISIRADPHLIQKIKSSSPIYDIDFNPNGQLFAVSDRDGHIKVYNSSDGQLIRTITAHNGALLAISFSPNGQMLVSSGSDGIVRLWNIENGSMIRTLAEIHLDPAHAVHKLDPSGQEQMLYPVFYSVTFSPDGRLVAIGGQDGRILLIQVDTGQILHDLRGHFFNNYYREILSVVFSPDGQLLASAGTGDSVYIWRVQDGELIRQLKAPTTNAEILGMAFFNNGKTLLLGRRTAEIETWTVADGRLLSVMNTQQKEIRSISFGPDKQEFVVGGGAAPNEYDGIPFLEKRRDTRIWIWHIGALQPMLTLNGHRDNVDAVAFSPDGRLLVSGSADGTIQLWRVQ